MNRRQRNKIVPNIWIIAAKRSDTAHNYFALYAIDWRRGARLSWEGWTRYEDFLQFRVPLKRKVAGRANSSQPAAKIAKKALYLQLNEAQYEELEQLFYQPFSRKRWKVFMKEHTRKEVDWDCCFLLTLEDYLYLDHQIHSEVKPVKWEDITELHPGRFVLVEAIKASSNNQLRQLEDMSVIQDYDDPQKAWSGYKEMHKLHPSRELYVFHTSRSDVEVVEEFFSGVRQRT